MTTEKQFKTTEQPGPGLAWNLDFAKVGGFEPKVKRFPKLSELGDVVSKLVWPKRITDGGLEAAAGRFFVSFFLKKKLL